MKTIHNIYPGIVWALFLLAVGSCKDTGLSEGSYLSTTPPPRNSLDTWILENYTHPYNIEVIYRWKEAAVVNQMKYLYPPAPDKVLSALEMVKKLWIDPYSSMDPYILKKAAPRQIVLVGGAYVEGLPDGGGVKEMLGYAEGGKRIAILAVNLLETNLPETASRERLSLLMHTIQHEYVHILNQTKPFDEEGYGRITPSEYTAQWTDEDDEGAHKKGFITRYSRANVYEDFAEMASVMLLMNNEEWNKYLDKIGNPTDDLEPDNDLKEAEDLKKGVDLIRQKEKLVVEYYKEAYGIDFYQLQEAVYQATLKLL